MNSPAAAPTVWVLWRRRKGDLDQMLALLNAVGWPYAIKKLSFLKPDIPILAPLLLKGSSDRLDPPWPDFIFSAEALPSLIARRLKARSGGRIRTVCIGRPAGAPGAFDLIITSAQYRIPPAPNVVELAMPLTSKTAAGQPEPFAFAGNRPLVALIVGGASFPDRLNEKTAGTMARAVLQYTEKKGGTLVAITSPRTEAAITGLLGALITAPHHILTYGQGEDRYRAMLAAADEIVITSDSVSMVADAFELGKPVSIYPLPRDLSPKWQLTEWLFHHAVEDPYGWLKPIKWAFEAGVLETAADRRLLFNKLASDGQLNWFGKPLRTPETDTSRRDLERAAAALQALAASRA